MDFTKISFCDHQAHFLFRIEISDVSPNWIGEIEPACSISFLNALGIHHSQIKSGVTKKKLLSTPMLQKNSMGKNHNNRLVSHLAIQVNIRTANRKNGKWILIEDHS
ncbi:MAG TPA: hypothetical protein ENI07_21960 [Desulfobacterales bacterium]|nr:hypothetical protein [Desulfobacterales bacterium]